MFGDVAETRSQAYIDFEIEEAERERARHLYERLLERTSHVKVYISYALMEASTLGGGEDEDGNEVQGVAGDEEMARHIFERGYKDLRTRGEKEDVSRGFLGRRSDSETTLTHDTAGTIARSVEDVRRATWVRRRTGQGPGNDADDPKEVEESGRWQWSAGRVLGHCVPRRRARGQPDNLQVLPGCAELGCAKVAGGWWGAVVRNAV